VRKMFPSPHVFRSKSLLILSEGCLSLDPTPLLSGSGSTSSEALRFSGSPPALRPKGLGSGSLTRDAEWVPMPRMTVFDFLLMNV